MQSSVFVGLLYGQDIAEAFSAIGRRGTRGNDDGDAASDQNGYYRVNLPVSKRRIKHRDIKGMRRGESECV